MYGMLVIVCRVEAEELLCFMSFQVDLSVDGTV